jgi:hypothetical protein
MIYSKTCEDIGAQLLRKIENWHCHCPIYQKNTHNQIEKEKMFI